MKKIFVAFALALFTSLALVSCGGESCEKDCKKESCEGKSKEECTKKCAEDCEKECCSKTAVSSDSAAVEAEETTEEEVSDSSAVETEEAHEEHEHTDGD